jgi:hypothetical protein
MNIPKPGTKWVSSSDYKIFRILSVVELEGHTWVHYIQETTGQEYSCYLESFLSRFGESCND